MTRAQTTSTTQQNTGGAVAPSVAGKNAVINGAFDIWQRGTSFSTTATSYTTDRWLSYVSASGSPVFTYSRQTTSDTTNLPFIQYCMRIQRTASQTYTNTMYFAQMFETVNSIPYAGKQVTLSFYARKGANYSSASDALSYYINTGTGTDQNNASGTYTGLATPLSGTATLTTTWQRFSATATLSSTATEIEVRFNWTPSGTAGAADYCEVTGVQLEVGSVATPFARAGGTIQGELAACQRYYFRQTVSDAYGPFSMGMCYSSTQANPLLVHPVTMRTKPSVLEYSTLAFNVSNGGTVSVGTLTINLSTPSVTTLNTTTTSGLTAGNATMMLAFNSTSAYVALGAEL